MKEVTLKIPEHQYQFFLELVHNLGFELVEEMDIPDEHKNMVRERVKNSKPDALNLWQEARKQLSFKSKL